MLYLALGDGGGGGDNEDNGQDRTTLLGAILRLDVHQGADAPPWHAVPADNPFVGNAEGWREEIWAFGLRNPWRISFDPQTGDLWTGDVGQNLWEEIDRVEKGGNHGWDCREGTHAYTGPPGAPSPACADAGPFVEPVYEYPHADGNLSITGGHVYRGSALVDLRGRYVYADYVSGRVWAVDLDGTDNALLVDADFSISSFGRDGAGELYAVEYGPTAGIWKLVAAED
jgi:glucose/arabinose dehydrogenase